MEDEVKDVTSLEGQDVTQLEGADNTDQVNNTEIVLPTTPEELQKLLQAEGDKRVTSAQKKWAEKQKQEIANAQEEATKLAKMSAAEREKAKFDKEKAELEADRAQLAQERLKTQTSQELINNGLPADFVDFVIASDAETVNENIKNFKTAFDNAVEEAVKKRIATPTPKKSTSNLNNKTQSGVMAAIKSKRAR